MELQWARRVKMARAVVSSRSHLLRRTDPWQLIVCA